MVSSNVILKRFQKENISDEYLSWLNDQKVVKYSVQRHISHDRSTAEAYLDWMAQRGGIVFAIYDKSQNRHVGNISLDFDPPNLTCDMALMIGNRSFWGKGIAKEAWIAVRDFAFEQLGYRKINAGTLSVNTPMLKLAVNTGMVPDGVQKDQYIWEGQLVDRVFFAFFNKSFQQKSEE